VDRRGRHRARQPARGQRERGWRERGWRQRGWGSAGGTAARLTAALARAIARCSSVTVTEEGYRVTLALAPAPAPASAASAAGREAHAYRATGALGGIPLEMDIVLTRVGGVVLLLTNTSLGGTADPALTATAVRAAAARAARA